MPLLKILGTRGYVVSLSSPSLVLPSCPYYIFPLFGIVYNSPRDWNLLYRKSICMHLSSCKIGWEGGEGELAQSFKGGKTSVKVGESPPPRINLVVQK